MQSVDEQRRDNRVGLRVLVTRPGEQAVSWVQALRLQGIDAVATPLIGIAQAPDLPAVDSVWATIDQWSLLVFVSPNAVTQFFSRQPAGRIWPPSLRAAAPGPGTSALLREHGIAEAWLTEPSADAIDFDSESLWQRLRKSDWRGARVLIVRGDGGRNWLAEQFGEAGAEVQFLAAYRRGEAALSAPSRETMTDALARPAEHLWFFSSSEAVANLLRAGLMVDQDLRRALAASCALATHPRIAEAASDVGFATVLRSRPALADVVACIQSQRPLECSSAPRRAL